MAHKFYYDSWFTKDMVRLATSRRIDGKVYGY